MSLLVVVLLGVRLRQGRWTVAHAASVVAPVVLILAAVHLYRYVTFGDLLPNTWCAT